MMLGGIAFRLGRIGVLSLAPLARSTPLWRLASYGAGLAMETTAFEAASNLTSPEGLRNAEFSERWLSSFVQFGLLRGSGALTSGRNVFLRHLISDTSLVAGRQTSASLGLAPAPEGDWTRQFLHAEATTLHSEFGMAWGRLLFGEGIERWERALNHSLPALRPDSSRTQEFLRRPGVFGEASLRKFATPLLALGALGMTVLETATAHAAVPLGDAASSHPSGWGGFGLLGIGVLASVLRGRGSRLPAPSEGVQLSLGENPRHTLRRQFFQELADSGLSPEHRTLLNQLVRSGQGTLVELGNRIGKEIPVGQVRPQLARLVEVGLADSYGMPKSSGFQETVYQVTPLGREVHRLFQVFDLGLILPPLGRGILRHLGSGRPIMEKTIVAEFSREISEEEIRRVLANLHRFHLVSQQWHPTQFRALTYQLTETGQEQLQKDERRRETLAKLLRESVSR